MGKRLTPLGAIARGAVAGAVGTVAMDAVWYARHRRGGGDKPPLAWEFDLDVQRWEDAPAPAQFGRKLFVALTRRDIPVSRAALVNNLMHWGYGVGWGAQLGAYAGWLHPQRRAAVVPLGLALGSLVWLSSYVTLPLAGLYKPIWEYDAGVLARDLTAHLAYGLGTGAAFALLAAPPD